MTQLQTEIVQFPAGGQARLLRVALDADDGQIVDALALARPRAVLVLNGGTAQLEADLHEQLGRLLGDGLARAAAEEQLTTVTGATDAGVFALFGQGLARWGRTAPCIGVTVAGPVAWPGHSQAGATQLEPHHSHFVLVEAQRWGEETSTMYSLIDTLSRQCPSLAVFAGGGQIMLQEMETNIDQGRAMILLAGSGRMTDAVLAARAGQPADDPRVVEIARKGKITAFDIKQDPAALRDLIRHSLFGKDL